MEAIIFYFDKTGTLREMDVSDDRLLYLSPGVFPWIEKIVFKLPDWENEAAKTRETLHKG